MRNKFKIYIILAFLTFGIENKVSANDFNFNTSEINISENGNTIEATEGTATSVKDKIKIKAKKFIYNKRLSTLYASQGVATSQENNIQISGDKFEYNGKNSTINIIGNVEIKDLEEGTLIKSQNIFYNAKIGVLKSDTESKISDDNNNVFIVENFIYTLNDSLIKIENAKLIDSQKNITKIEKAYINLVSNKLIGKDLSIDFNNTAFNANNNPRLKGNTISSNKDETIVSKGNFTLCKKNDDCPPWQISADEIRHDKKNKIIHYKNAWLRLYDKPVFYFPKFFHPDPTVKRQSGFLMPTFTDSSALGASLIVPYYNVISDNKDLTVTPRFYSNDKILLQSEYREVNAKYNHILDLSFMSEKNASTKSHFFSKTARNIQLNNFEDSELSLEIQQTSNDTYLKTYKLKSPIINNTNTLSSTLGFNAYREDLSLNAEFYAYEDLTKKEKSDRFEFIYPSYSLAKQLDSELNGNFTLSSTGFMKNYDTNIFEKVMINDFIFNSDSIFSDYGIESNYNFLIKNINTNGQNSANYKSKNDHKLEFIHEFNSSYPLIKKNENYTNVLKPMASIKYSPSKSKNMRNDDKRIDIGNIFSFNRIGVNDSVEGGTSITYGLEFTKNNKSDIEVFAGKIASSSRFEKDDNLPNSSSIGEKTSNIVGGLSYNPNKFFDINYDFAVKNNLNDKNYELLSTDFNINNFVSTFEYLNENNTSGKESYLSNKTTLNINGSSSFIFEGRENKKTKLTEYYNLIYQYRNDCLIAAIEYNKDYYSDRDLKPEENIFFKLTIIPFGQTSSPNLK
jgi:LPS-assembly protein